MKKVAFDSIIKKASSDNLVAAFHGCNTIIITTITEINKQINNSYHYHQERNFLVQKMLMYNI